LVAVAKRRLFPRLPFLLQNDAFSLACHSCCLFVVVTFFYRSWSSWVENKKLTTGNLVLYFLLRIVVAVVMFVFAIDAEVDVEVVS
jgi:hypothetical protein